MEQTMTQLSLRSRITSSSNSFQPMTDSSIRTVWFRLAFSPPAAIAPGAPRCWYAVPPPVPPSVKLGRMITG
jgi:hypothetical protein